MRFLLMRSGVLAVGLGFVAWYLNRTRGIGWMFVLFVVLALVLHYALTSTKWGKAVYAVGGNVEAARRAGINVRLVYASVLAICTTLAAFGGVLGAARLAAANHANPVDLERTDVAQARLVVPLLRHRSRSAPGSRRRLTGPPQPHDARTCVTT